MKGIWKIMMCVLVAAMFVTPVAQITGQVGNKEINKPKGIVQGASSDDTLRVGEDESRERYAIAMGFAFDGIMQDAYALRDILHDNTPEIWPLDHIKLYSHDSWDNILEGLQWIESQEDSNDITIWQSAGHGSPDGLASENGFISYSDLNEEFDKFDGCLLIMICACGSCYAHTKLAGDNRIIITGRQPLDSLPCGCQKSEERGQSPSSSLWTYFINHFVRPSHGAWGNEICDIDYGNKDGWVSAEEAFAYVEDSFEWPDEVWNDWCFAHLYMTDGVSGELPITLLTNNHPNTPEKPSGPTSGRIGNTYTYTTSAIDPNGDRVNYGWDWDGDKIVDKWTSYHNSGESIETAHSWDEKGNYEIRVKAKDEHGEESEWSDPLAVSMPKTYERPLLSFLEQFTNWFMNLLWAVQ